MAGTNRAGASTQGRGESETASASPRQSDLPECESSFGSARYAGVVTASAQIPLLGAERDLVAAACRRLAAAGLVHGTSGNVSVRAGDHVAVTPTGAVLADLHAHRTCA